MFNPVAVGKIGNKQTLQDNTRASFYYPVQYLTSLIYDGTITLDISDAKTASFLPWEALGYEFLSTSTNKARESYTKNSSVTTKNQLLFTPSLGDGHELVIQGVVDTESKTDRFYATETYRSASP